MTSEALNQRTKEFALRVITLIEELPNAKGTDVMGRQLSNRFTGVSYSSRVVLVVNVRSLPCCKKRTT